MSRLAAIQVAVGVQVTAAFTAASETVTLSYDPDAFDAVEQSQMPFARILFVEEEPEALAFRQERRRVNGTVTIAMLGKLRGDVHNRLEAIRDLLFASETLSTQVDYIMAEAGEAFTTPDDPIVYGTLDVSTEEIF